MRVPLGWLRNFCNPELPLEELAERLTMTGTKVESVQPPVADGFKRFAVGRVEVAEPHPNADRLRVCHVDLGDRRAQIVCGAPNVAAGQLVAVALPGARLPDGRELAEATLRGVRSEGMILSAAELGLAGDREGILVLEGPAFLDELGNRQPVAAGLSLARLIGGEGVLELEVTPNRPDCLSVYGVAREVHAATGAPLAGEPWREDRGNGGPLAGVKIAVAAPELCPRFMARLFTGVQVRPSPLWLQARLIEAGQRPINNVVDITNYVMLLTGQPLHAFDFELIAGGELTVRRGRAGEVVATLDGQEREVDEEVVVIADGEGPTSIAGIIGGARSEVSPRTTAVLLEAATWDGPNIHASSFRLGVRSEAASRFEKGLPQESAQWGLAVATNLLIALAGARQEGGTIDIQAAPPPAAPQIALRTERVGKVLGVEVPEQRQAELLGALGFAPRPGAGGELICTVPPWRRGDVTREADLIEEIARLDALARLPATLPARRGGGRLTASQRLRRRLADLLVARGFHEIYGWTFTSAEQLARLRLGEERRWLALRNPLSADQRYLRPTLLLSLRAAAAYNADRDQTELRLFEVGRVFARAEGAVSEEERIAALACGPLQPRGWRQREAQTWDLFSIKAVVEELLRLAGVEAEFSQAGDLPFLHPGRAAAVVVEGRSIGWLGELHPEVVPEGLERVAAFELAVAPLLARAGRTAVFRELPAFPSLRRDISLLVPKEVAAQAVLAAIRKAGGRLLEEARVIDLYDHPSLGKEVRSLAISLAFRAADRTLTEREVDPVVEEIVAATARLGCRLRGSDGG